MPEAPSPKHRPVVPPPTSARGTSSWPYAELDVTTNFSFLRGASHPDELVYRAAELGHTALAVTDLNSVAGIVRAHQAAKEVGIKLCVGARLRFADAPDILVWPENRSGYANLCRLLTTGKRRAEKGSCNLHLQDLLATSRGLLAALVCRSIDPQVSEPDPAAIDIAAGALKDAFGRSLSITVSRVYGPLDRLALRQAESVSRAYDIPLLATNQVHYHDERRQTLQDVLTCIRHGCTIHDAGFRLFPNGERFIKPPEEMHRLFRDLPAALRRTVGIAERCAFSLDELRYEYPDEIGPAGKTPASYLAELTWAGAAGRYPHGIPEKVRQQIAHELALIEQLGIEPYFLTVHDLVRFARSRGILCQGRGSAANSAVCYCLGVTSVDPHRIDVLFERFVSAARDEPPDIDIDFEHERREEVIQYLYGKYGRERAGMTAEIISYRGRSAVRDVGKVMGLGLDAVDALAKRLEGWSDGAPPDEQIREAGLDPADRTVRLTIALTRELLGFPRHLSQHVGGMVMTRGPLCELVPIENASMQDRTVIEWDKDDIDALGILKVDVLALGMLTALAKGMKLINDIRPTEPPIELHTIPPEDPGVYAMVSDADTIGVFQIESRAQMSMLPRLRPSKFYDLVIEVAIVRPGPIQGDMVHPYLRRRDGIEPVSFPKPELEAVLGRTLGVPLFQEQAMKMVMVAAGFTAGEADQLRRAMAAWRHAGRIEQFQQKMIEGMLANGYTRDFAGRCFNQIKGFGEYGFPESHAASFALLVYASAWIKRYHPAAFCTALLNSQPMGFYAPAQIVRDAREHGVQVRAVDVNHSDWDCILEGATDPPPSVPTAEKRTWGIGGPAVRLGFRIIKGLREAHARQIVERRHWHGPFHSIDDFHASAELPVSTVAKLSQADAFATLPKSRRAALWETLALPEERVPLGMRPGESALPSLPPMALGQEIHADYGTTGLSLKGHPVQLIRKELARRRVIPAAQVWNRPHGRWVSVAGVVVIRQRPGTAKGIVFETLEDETGVVNLIIRPDVYDRCRDAARNASVLQADGYVERQGQVQHVMAVRLHDLSHLVTDCSLRSRDFH
ncbi:MAG TPA: error-prone DNA polymerase [Tepidisphaeraceae bacterium]|jgi:error-prone DNA polymerase|nr:error-prone DNA polymerase [Tepidisphaeraceae bacterium]